ncbi:hypothetical protein MUN81_04565 [Hymenobacter sp. 5317J-9]|uniref:hypothetical protein n=1 Tax=Hymenobacter sp. 5317J-9 TaxID=2932250 RepID=UPI001FD67E77|nr:hypothetical protein [Hymenobacter sp. 5317J-9]UOQ98767.1 hypothetical protein MUN81_04565 [Hymenobacter sp. 5317J-9]
MYTLRCWLFVLVTWTLCGSACRSARTSYQFHDVAQRQVAQAPSNELPALTRAAAAQVQEIQLQPAVALPNTHRISRRPKQVPHFSHTTASLVNEPEKETHPAGRTLPVDSTKLRGRRTVRGEYSPPGTTTGITMLVLGGLQLLGAFLLRQSAIAGGRAGAPIAEGIVKGYFVSILLVLGVVTLLIGFIILAINDSKKRKHLHS